MKLFVKEHYNNVGQKNLKDHTILKQEITKTSKKLDQICPRQESKQAEGKRKEVRVLSFTSGKGGVGKTHIVVNLAYALQQLGARVMILDADLELANVDVLLGLAPQFNIQHVLEGKKKLSDILLQGPAGMTILPASTGVCEVAQISEAQRFHLLDALDELYHDLDFLLVDTVVS